MLVKLRTVQWVMVWLLSGAPAAAGTSAFTPRDVPIRWVELHASRHPECQTDGVPFRGPIGAREPSAWRTSEWLHWMIERMNVVYAGSGIRFWLQSHDVFCTDAVAEWVEGQDQFTPIPWASVQGDIGALYPHSQPFNLGGEALSRERWLEKAFILYGDPHGLTLITHNDYQDGVGDPRISPDILPQHGYAPWYTPGVVFVFLSGYTQTPGWAFDPELTVAHEIGHDLGNCHTLDFTVCVCQTPGFPVECALPEPGGAAFPDGAPYRWADHWDLIYAGGPEGPKAFGGRAQAQAWIGVNGTDDLHPIDLLSNISLDPATGRATALLATEPDQPYYSESLVPSVYLGQQRLLQGLSFGFPYEGYSWQRNLMSYRYAPGVDPYDYLTARFSTSQIEVMQRQLQGSVAFPPDLHGVRPPGTEARFAGRYHLLGDGTTQNFVWYSNGEGPGNVDATNDIPDKVAFRSAPAALLPAGQYTSADFDQDGTDDLAALVDGGSALRLFLSRIDSSDGLHNVHRFEETLLVLPDGIGGYERVAPGDFDGDGLQDLFLGSEARDALVVRLAAGRGCDPGPVCVAEALPVAVRVDGPVAVGNFDGALGDDVLLVSHVRGTTFARALWSVAGRGLGDAGRAKRVARGTAFPHAGNFDGGRAADVLWFDAGRERQRIWKGSEHKARKSCVGSDAPKCYYSAFQSKGTVTVGEPVEPALVGVTVGDFDGNGADDFMIRNSHQPPIFFAVPGAPGGFVQMDVAFHNSFYYGAAVGEFDAASDAAGDSLGDDLLLFTPEL